MGAHSIMQLSLGQERGTSLGVTKLLGPKNV